MSRTGKVWIATEAGDHSVNKRPGRYVQRTVCPGVWRQRELLRRSDEKGAGKENWDPPVRSRQRQAEQSGLGSARGEKERIPGSPQYDPLGYSGKY